MKRYLVTYKSDISCEMFMENGLFSGSISHEMSRNTNKQTGASGEEIAGKFLEGKGFVIVARNYRQKWGEIDIIAEKNGVVHIVEVKAVSGRLDGSHETQTYIPEELAHPSKLRKVARTAELYMEAVGDTREFQIDVVGVIMDSEKKIARCRFFEQVLG